MEGITRFFIDGGTFMFVILAVLFIGLAFCLERFVTLAKATSANKNFWAELFPLLQKGQFKQAMELSKDSNTEIARIMSYGLSRSTVTSDVSEIEMALEEGLMDTVPRLEQRTPYIATLANIATLLGLLGTIMGLIDAFTAVANADPAEKADMLSASISIAMNTTAFGLMAAIPLLFAFTFLQQKTGKVIGSLEQSSVRFLNIYRQVRAAKAQKA